MLGPGNHLGIALVALAQGCGQSVFLAIVRQLMNQEQIWQETHPYHFGMLSAVLAAVGLTATRDTPYQDVVFVALLVWFEVMAVYFALGGSGAKKDDSKQSSKKKNRKQANKQD